MVSALIRWTVFGVGVLVTGAFLISLVFGPHNLGRGFDRARNIVGAAVTFYMALGALFQHPFGWYAALVAAIVTPVEVLVRYRWIRSGGRANLWFNLATSAFMIGLLMLLLTASGRAAFGLRPLTLLSGGFRDY
jgi:hypothetical protein